MFVTTHYVCFESLAIFGQTRLTIPLTNIASVQKVSLVLSLMLLLTPVGVYVDQICVFRQHSRYSVARWNGISVSDLTP